MTAELWIVDDDPAVTSSLSALLIAGIEARYRLLTERERQVMALVVQGLSSKEVAQRLATSPRTIDIHRNHMMAKVKAGSLSELVRQSILLDSGGAESWHPSRRKSATFPRQPTRLDQPG